MDNFIERGDAWLLPLEDRVPGTRETFDQFLGRKFGDLNLDVANV